MGPWTYRGVVLRPVSSTTSHAGAVEFKGRWYLTYHTADAKGGGHFRRSVAIDPMAWDDSVSSPAIRPVRPTRAPAPPAAPTRNVASSARPTASNAPGPAQYWIAALNDGKVRSSPLPPDMWGNWTKQNPASAWIEYRWPHPVTLNGTRIRFFADHPAGADEGVAPPAAWHLEYWDGGWRRIAGTYPTGVDGFQEVRFPPVTTRCLRAELEASGAGERYAGLAVEEWEALAPTPVPVTQRSVEALAGCAGD